MRYTTKLRFMMGLAHRTIEMIGTSASPRVEIEMGELAALVSLSAIAAASPSAHGADKTGVTDKTITEIKENNERLRQIGEERKERERADEVQWMAQFTRADRLKSLLLTVSIAGTEIVELLAQRVPPGVNVSAETQIVGGLGLDSVGILDFIMDIEDRFDISIPLDRVAEVQTVAELCRAIEALKRAAG